MLSPPILVKSRYGSEHQRMSSEFIVLLLCVLIPRALPPSLDFSQARCISLICYPIWDTGPHAIQQGESCNHGFDILRPAPWRKIPAGLSFVMNDEFTFFPPCEVRFCRISLNINH